MSASSDSKYDIAVSFAGEQRDYVRKTVRACKARGLRVFFDEDKTNEWWGKNFLVEQRRAYSAEARYFVPFLSAEYLQKPIPMDEFSSAMFRAIEQGDDYILPVIVGAADVPAELLPQSIGYLRAETYTPEQLADELVKKVATAASLSQESSEVGRIVEDAFEIQLPRITPSTYSRYEEIDKIFDLLQSRFKAGGEKLRGQGLMTHLAGDSSKLTFRVEYAGNTVAGINIRKGGGISDDGISWLVGYSNYSASSFNGWAKSTFDTELGAPTIELNDFDIGSRGPDFDGSYDGFFEVLWAKVIRQIETAVR